MEKVFILAIAISILYFIIKIVEMKYIDKQNKPMKLIVRDTFMVFGCSFVPLLLFFQFDEKIQEIFQLGEPTDVPSQIFTDEPGF